MHLRRFSVIGYKNLQQLVSLDDLGPINVVHGPNNVGKSNLLEAMALFFRCLLPVGGELPIATSRRFNPNEIADIVDHVRELFHLDKPTPITMTGVLHVPQEELDAAGIARVYPVEDLDVEVVVEWDGDDAAIRMTRFQFSNGIDATQRMSSAEEKTKVLRFAKFLARNLLVREGPDQRFSIIGVRRDLEEDRIRRESDKVPLALEMYDCRESPDTVRRNRWRAFVRAMQEFQKTTGEGIFEVTYQRAESRAQLMFDTDKTRIPLRLLGTGVQQLAALLGHLLVRNASIVAIEEPELNLRFELQDQLRDAFKVLVADTSQIGGVSQLFITSHSPAFETGESFYSMERGTEGPVVTRRPASDLASVVGTPARHLGYPSRAPLVYVTSQGVTRLPPETLTRLGIDGGGSIVVQNVDEHAVRILSTDQYLDDLDCGDEPGSGHES